MTITYLVLRCRAFVHAPFRVFSTFLPGNPLSFYAPLVKTFFGAFFFLPFFSLLGLLQENERRINFVFPSRAVIQEFSLHSSRKTWGRPSSFVIWPLKVCFLFDISTFSPSAFRVSYRCFLACQTFCLFAFLFFFRKSRARDSPEMT